jgi:hypothetical protein
MQVRRDTQPVELLTACNSALYVNNPNDWQLTACPAQHQMWGPVFCLS